MEIRDCPDVINLLRRHRIACYEATKQIDSLVSKLCAMRDVSYETRQMMLQSRSLDEVRNLTNQAYQRLDPIIVEFEKVDRR